MLHGAPSLHVPLSTLIDYRGFRLTASRSGFVLVLFSVKPCGAHERVVSVLPVGKDTLIYGSDDQARTVHADVLALNDAMQRAGIALNLKGAPLWRELGVLDEDC
jgi:hypothetical protein